MERQIIVNIMRDLIVHDRNIDGLTLDLVGKGFFGQRHTWAPDTLTTLLIRVVD